MRTALEFRNLLRAGVVLFFLIFLAGRLTGTGSLDRWGNPFLPDFYSLYVAAERTWNGQGEEIYDQEAMTREIAQRMGDPAGGPVVLYVYPPWVSVILAPLGALPYEVSAGIVFVLNALVAGLLAFGIPCLFSLDPSSRLVAPWLFLASLPLIRTITFGQNGLVLLGLLACFWFCVQRRRWGQAGWILALLLYKPQFFPGVIGWYLWRTDRRGLATFGLSTLTLLGLGTLAGGWSIWKKWADSLLLISRGVEHEAWKHSLPTALGQWGCRGWPVWGLILLTGLITAVLLWRERRSASSPRDPELGLAIVLMLTLVLSPRVYTYDLVLVYPVLLFFWDRQNLSWRERWGRWVGGGILLLPLNDWLQPHGLPWITLLLVLLTIGLISLGKGVYGPRVLDA
jgi:hypothetical protein